MARQSGKADKILSQTQEGVNNLKEKMHARSQSVWGQVNSSQLKLDTNEANMIDVCKKHTVDHATSSKRSNAFSAINESI